MESLGLPDSLDPLPSLDFLPRNYVFKTGLRCVIRSATETDVAKMYASLSTASEQGLGYTLHEHPSQDYFRRLLLANSQSVVYEDLADGEMIGFSIITDSSFTRTEVNT